MTNQRLEGTVMLNGVLTRWELTPKEKYEEFHTQLLEYLKTKLIPVRVSNGMIHWTCGVDHEALIHDSLDPDIDPFEHSREFCTQNHLDWSEVRDLIEHHTGFDIFCDCDILEESELNEKDRVYAERAEENDKCALKDMLKDLKDIDKEIGPLGIDYEYFERKILGPDREEQQGRGKIEMVKRITT
jgi:hypothetical protein